MDDLSQRMDGLFVQSATSFASREDEMTLHGVVSSTVYFVDRPRREVGHISTRRFLDFWAEGVHGMFAEDPPRAVLSFLEVDGAPPDDIGLVLLDPQLDEEALTYTVESVEGSLPETGGPCSLFIDVFRSPLMAASIGSRRRVKGPTPRD